jgi:hypothetical protein
MRPALRAGVGPWALSCLSLISSFLRGFGAGFPGVWTPVGCRTCRARAVPRAPPCAGPRSRDRAGRDPVTWGPGRGARARRGAPGAGAGGRAETESGRRARGWRVAGGPSAAPGSRRQTLNGTRLFSLCHRTRMVHFLPPFTYSRAPRSAGARPPSVAAGRVPLSKRLAAHVVSCARDLASAAAPC